MIKLAVDIDNTIYDTRRCEKDVCNLAWSKFPDDPLARIKYEDELSADGNTWFNPDYLIPEAIRALKSLGDEVRLYICTARHMNDMSYYTKLLGGTGLTFKGIMQGGDYPGKAQACLKNGIDVLVDDDIHNVSRHKALMRRDSSYNTHFVYYVGHSVAYCEDSAKVTVMHKWDDFCAILANITK